MSSTPFAFLRAGSARIPVTLRVASLALALATCRDGTGPEVRLARIEVAPVLPSAAALAEFGLTIDAVRLVVVRPQTDTLADTTVALPPGATEVAVELRVPLVASPESLRVSVLALSGTVPLFSGTRLVQVPTPRPPPLILVDAYVGPVADSIVIQPRSPFILVNDSLRFQVQGFNGGVPVTQFYVAWSSSDSAVAPINRFGVLRAPAARAAVRVRARTPSGASDSVPVVFAPPATQLVQVGGDGQSETVGQQLAIPLEVEARASDGLGVGGVSVRFRSLTVGGAVTDSVVVTDVAGRARTTARLGGAIGAQSFEASAAGLAGSPVTFVATALPGPPAQLTASAGDAQLAVVGSAVAARPAVRVTDAGGNPVAGVGVTFTVALGGGGVTGGSQTTDATGTATVGTWTLGTAAGTNRLTASAAGLTRTFTANGVAGAATQLVRTAGDLQSALVGLAVGIAPAVRAQDQYANPVAGASVTFAVSGGGGAVSGAAPLTNAAGVASVGGWSLGTAVGANALTATLSGAPSTTFTATGLAGAPTQIARLTGDSQAAIVNTILPTTPAVIVRDQFNNPVPGVGVLFAPASGGGSVTGASAATDPTGVARVGSWRLGVVVGQNTLTASASGLAGSPVLFTATGLVDAASQMVPFAGDGQAGLVGTPVSTQPAVRVSDAFGNAVGGVPVTFAVGLGGGSLGVPTTVSSDTAGVAIGPAWTLGPSAGPNTINATATGLPAVTFTADGLASAATTIAYEVGTAQIGIVATVLSTPYSVVVTDGVSPVAGVPVSWAVISGGGTISPALDTTDAAGRATAVRTLGTAAGPQTAIASVGGLTGSPVTFTATALPDAPAWLVKQPPDPQTGTVATAVAAPVVKVTDQFGNGVGGVIVDFAAGGGGAVGAARDASDGLGFATAGSWTLGSLVGTNTVTATAGALPAVTFTATSLAGSPTRLAFLAEPTRALAGDTIDPAVSVVIQDQFQNTVPVNDTVSLGLGATLDPAAKLVGTTDIAAFNGVAVFANVAIDSAGPGYTVIATAAGLAGAESTPFDVGGVTDAFMSEGLRPVAAAFSSATGLVYLPGVNRTLGVFDPGKAQITQFPILQDEPFGVAANVVTNRVYITTFAALVGAVIVIDARDPSAILAAIPIVTGEPRGIAVDEATDHIFVAVGGDPGKSIPPSLAIVDGKDNRVVVSIPFPEGAVAGLGVAFNPNDRLVYVAIPNLGVGVFDPETGSFVRLISIVGEQGAAGTYGVAVDARTNFLYATNRADGTVSVIELSTMKDWRLRVGPLPEGLAVDQDRGAVYVGNSGDNTVSFIDAAKLAVFATLIVGPTPKAVAVDPASGRFYVPTFEDDRVRVVQP